MSEYTEMSNMQLTQLVKKLEEELEHLRRQLGSSGVPDPLTVSKVSVTGSIIEVGTNASDSSIQMFSDNLAGADSGTIYAYNTISNGMTLRFVGFDRIEAKDGSPIWP